MNSVAAWCSGLFVKAIQSFLSDRDRNDVLAWLALCREITDEQTIGKVEKIWRIYAISSFTGTIGMMFNGLVKSVQNYKDSNLPLAVKIALPATLASAAFFGGQAVGVAGFGGAIGVPLLLVIFLGSAVITSILQAFWGNSSSRGYIGAVLCLIAQDEMLRRVNQTMRNAMTASPVEPKRSNLTEDADFLAYELRNLDPFEFERHVMSFFQSKGLIAWVTKKTNDLGVDGFARHHEGLIVVQCKRYAEQNLVSRPEVQQFKGVIEENGAWKGYLVTTSGFTNQAIESATRNDRLILVDFTKLSEWHQDLNSLAIA